MNKVSLYFLMAVISLGGFSACDDSESEESNDGYGADFTGTLAAYVDNTVVPTYADMKDKAILLFEAVEELSGSKTDANVEKVCEAWRTTRVPWEQSEAFLYGPAAIQNLDPLIDSWPLDQSSIEGVLSGNSTIIGENLGEAVRGFHTIEYLVFLNSHPRKAAEITDRQMEYLSVVTETLRNDCFKLWISWHGSKGISESDQELLDEIEFEVEENGYGWEFKQAGERGSRYLSQDLAIDAIISGCITIAEEVGAQKIGGPNATAKEGNLEKAVLDVESWYSWNSIDDYANNIVSIDNSYMGGPENNRGTSLSDYVKGRDPLLDTEVKNAIKNAYQAIKSMEYPFRNHLTGAAVDNAINSCASLSESLRKIKALKNQ